MSHRSEILVLALLVGCAGEATPTSPTVVLPTPDDTAMEPQDTGPLVTPVPPAPPSPEPCDALAFLAPTAVGPVQSVALGVTGGIGPFSYALVDDVSGGAINRGSGLWLTGSTPGLDVVSVTDEGCQLTLEATVEVLTPVVAVPADATVPPGITFDVAMAGGSGTFTCAPADLAPAATLTGCTLSVGAEGVSVVQVTDTVSGKVADATITVAVDATLLAQELHLVPAGRPYTPEFAGGSGRLEVVGQPSMNIVDEALVATTQGSFETLLRDPVTGMEQTVTVVVAEPRALDAATLPRDGEVLDDGDIVVGDLDGDGFDDIVVGLLARNHAARRGGTIAVFPGTATGPATTPALVLGAEQEDERAGRRLALADLDDDGELDLVIGANGWARGASTRVGRVLVHRGIVGGLVDPDPTWILEGEAREDQLGASMATCDLNGDGIDDLIVGGPGLDDDRVSPTVQATGGVHVYFGGPDGPLPFPSRVWYPTRAVGDARLAEAGHALATGDVDGDGVCDVAIGGYVGDALDEGESRGGVFVARGGDLLSGAPSWRILAPSAGQDNVQLGRQVTFFQATGSTHDALAVTAPRATVDGDGSAGSLLAFTSDTLMAATAPLDAFTDADWRVDGATSNDFLGYDVDASGPGELLIGVVRSTPVGGGGERGGVFRATVDFMATAAVDVDTFPAVDGLSGGSFFGAVVQPLGDGLVTLATREQHPDRLPPGILDGAVWHVPATGEPVELRIPGAAVGGELGRSLAWIDVDGGAPEIVTGTPRLGVQGVGKDVGGVVSFPTDPTASPTIRAPFAELDQDETLGGRLRNVGDLDGDGFDDLAASGRYRSYSGPLPAGYATGTCPTNNRSRTGAVYIWLGSASGMGDAPDFVVFGETTNHELYTMSDALDFDGDGQHGLAVGSPRTRTVRVFDGPWIPTPGAIVERCDAETTLDGPPGLFGYRLAGVPSVDGDACDELLVASPGDDVNGNNRGTLRLFRGCATGASWRAWSAGANNRELGRGGLVVHDLSGDGRPEIAVGSRLADAPGATDAGNVWVVDGAVFDGTDAIWTNSSPSTDLSGLSSETADVPVHLLVGTSEDERFGQALAVDGAGRLLIGRPGADGRRGGVVALDWSSGGPGDVAYRIGGGDPASFLGASLATAGPEVLVGSPASDAGGPSGGAVFRFTVP